MERAVDDLEALLTQDQLAQAADNTVIGSPGVAPRWDPSGIWSMRVRDAREPRPTDGDEIPS